MIEPACTSDFNWNQCQSISKLYGYEFGTHMLTATTVSILVPTSSEHCQHCSFPANLAHLLQARASALEEFDSIMTDSASSMKADAPLVTSADKTAWWCKRLELDQRMAALLQHLDDDWLGPWKYDAAFDFITVPCSHVAAACDVSLCTLFAVFFWLSWASCRARFLADVCGHCC